MILATAAAQARAARLLSETFGGATLLPVPLARICTACGIKLWRRPMTDIDALAIGERHGRTGIVVNSRKSPRRIRFSLAHEMGHIFLGHFRTDIEIDAIRKMAMEYAANAFAAELIMPQHLNTLCGWTPSTLSLACGVSRQAARIRIRSWATGQSTP